MLEQQQIMNELTKAITQLQEQNNALKNTIIQRASSIHDALLILTECKNQLEQHGFIPVKVIINYNNY
jgi:RNA-binding protein YhbY